MKKTVLIITALLLSFGLGFYISALTVKPAENKPAKQVAGKSAIQTHHEKRNHLKLGAFSISLSVKDLEVSKAFYENLGFTHFAGSMAQHYLIMKNENALIGLFQGMFQGNILTFNPGWDENAQNTRQFDDVRKIQQVLKNKGITINGEADESTKGPASFMITDPDGNVVLVDQHR
jgi:predicted lactoylglutathione lyase